MFDRADAYERFMGRWSRRLAPEMVVVAGVRDGDALLDVGTGTGALTLAMRDATRTASIIGIDLSHEYITGASMRDAGERVRFEVGDARRLRFADASFDRALSMLVINFIPEPARALGEMARVTRPGGTVAAAVWDYGGGMEMLRVFWDEAITLDPAIEPRDEANMPLCRRGELAALFEQQGLERVDEAPLVIETRFESFDDYWSPFLLGQGPAGAHVAALPGHRRQALEGRLRARLVGDGPDRPIDLRARAWAVTGRV